MSPDTRPVRLPGPDPLIERLRGAGCVFAEDEAALLHAELADPSDLERAVRERLAGRPLEQVLGWAALCGLRVRLAPGVFVPRLRTELLARVGAGLVGPGDQVVDLCCGSGAVALALRSVVPGVAVIATDLSPAAVACARRNLPYATVLTGDLDAPLPRSLLGRVDLLVANAPYVPTGQIAGLPPEARLHEPVLALDGGPDGLALHRALAVRAARWLRPGGHLVVETSEAQVDRSAALFAAGGLHTTAVRCDELGAVVVLGRRAG